MVTPWQHHLEKKKKLIKYMVESNKLFLYLKKHKTKQKQTNKQKPLIICYLELLIRQIKLKELSVIASGKKNLQTFQK